MLFWNKKLKYLILETKGAILTPPQPLCFPPGTKKGPSIWHTGTRKCFFKEEKSTYLRKHHVFLAKVLRRWNQLFALVGKMRSNHPKPPFKQGYD